jgi:hypothetical protein
VAVVFVAIIIVGVRAGEAMGQPLDAPELKVLDRWAGDWIFEASFEKTKF